MQRSWLKPVIGALAIGLSVFGLAWFAWPQPIAVDLATVVAGPMEVTVDDEAKTRVRHIYTVSAPVAGKVLRISNPDSHGGFSLHVGDRVTAGETVVAIMQPIAPGLLDVRSRAELQAGLAAAEAAVKLSEAEIRRSDVALELSRSEFQRTQTLVRTSTAPAKLLEKAKADMDANDAAMASSKAQLEVRRSELATAAARLIEPSNGVSDPPPTCCIQVRAPMSGRVLKVIQESENIVQSGAPLVDIGDPLDLEVVADLLSTDAVGIDVGAAVRIDGWGGSPTLGRVTRVDPSGFVKVSALGIEEQRVRTTIEFTEPPAVWSRLGNDYRVVVHVGMWSADRVLTLPVGALFRKGDDWAVFAVVSGRTRTTRVTIGHRNSRLVEVLSGVSAGDHVVLHPSDRIRDGIAVAERDLS